MATLWFAPPRPVRHPGWLLEYLVRIWLTMPLMQRALLVGAAGLCVAVFVVAAYLFVRWEVWPPYRAPELRLLRLGTKAQQPLLSRSRRGQTLVLFAIVIPVIVALLYLVYSATTASRQKTGAQAASDAAARAGSMQIDVARYANGELALDCAAAEAKARQVLREGLADLPYALLPGVTPDTIASAAEITVINIVPDTPCSAGQDWWTSPYPPHNTYTQPVVTISIRVPSRVFFMDITLPAISEDTLRAPTGGTP